MASTPPSGTCPPGPPAVEQPASAPKATQHPDGKSFEESLGTVKFLGLQEQAAVRNKVRLVLRSGGFSALDLWQMVRGQVLISEPLRACERYGTENSSIWASVGMPVWPRTREPPSPADVPDFQRAPPPWLRCPLEERGLQYDDTVPCTQIQRVELYHDPDEIIPSPRGAPAAEDPAEAAMAPIRRGDIHPCELLFELGTQFLDDVLPSWTGQEPVLTLPPGDVAPLQAARYLVHSQRLRGDDFDNMLRSGVYVTGPGWLPCRDDGQRDQFHEMDVDQVPVPAARKRCPLQVRALLGDRSVPCAEAQVLHAPESLLRAARGAFPSGLRVPEDRPVYPEAGTPADPVRRAGLLPCQLLGSLLTGDFKEYLDRLQHDSAWEARDNRLLAARRPADLAAGAEWTA